MSEFKVYQFLNKNPRKGYASKALKKKLKNTSNIHRKLKQLKKRGMIRSTVIYLNSQAEKGFKVHYINPKPKKNTATAFVHIKTIHEVEQFVY